MLLELGLRNFKAFGDKEQKAPMSKITLIYGPNSGGKSSIIQALLMLKQSLDSEQGSGRELIPRGEYVDLGSFSALLHKHDTKRKLGISVAFDYDPPITFGVHMTFVASDTKDSAVLSGVAYQVLDENEALFDAKLKHNKSNENFWDVPHLSIANKIFPKKISQISMYRDFLPEMEILGLGELLQLVDENQESPRELERILTQDPEWEKAVKRDRERRWEWERDRERRWERRWEWEEEKGTAWEQMRERARERARERELERERELVLIRTLLREVKLKPEQILKLKPERILWNYEDILSSITYLGPLRNRPERLYVVLGGDRDSVGVRGEFTPHILSHNTEIRKKVNEWFKSLKIPYQLQELDEFGNVELAGKFVSIVLFDDRIQTPVTLADVGFGINQVLPVIIEGIASPPNTIICVEQPEIHLHPKLQAELADLIIEMSTGEDNKQWIVETHSELLIRRIQRRIREGTLTPNDVSVLYVDPGDDGSKIEVLELDEDGDFIDEWPHGFFDEGFNELMGE